MTKKQIVVAITIIVVGIILWLVFKPPQFLLNIIKPADLSNPVQTGEQIIEKYECRGCHRIAGEGALVGPVLDNISNQKDDDYLRLFLTDPRSAKDNARMPNLHLSQDEITAILAYLESIQNQGE